MEHNKTSLLTCISPLIYPVDKGTDSGEHSVVVGPTVLVPPTHSTTKNPSATFVAYERSPTVSLRSKKKLIYKIIPLARVGYRMVDSKRGAKCRVGYYRLIYTSRIITLSKINVQLELIAKTKTKLKLKTSTNVHLRYYRASYNGFYNVTRYSLILKSACAFIWRNIC